MSYAEPFLAEPVVHEPTPADLGINFPWEKNESTTIMGGKAQFLNFEEAELDSEESESVELPGKAQVSDTLQAKYWENQEISKDPQVELFSQDALSQEMQSHALNQESASCMYESDAQYVLSPGAELDHINPKDTTDCIADPTVYEFYNQQTSCEMYHHQASYDSYVQPIQQTYEQPQMGSQTTQSQYDQENTCPSFASSLVHPINDSGSLSCLPTEYEQRQPENVYEPQPKHNLAEPVVEPELNTVPKSMTHGDNSLDHTRLDTTDAMANLQLHNEATQTFGDFDMDFSTDLLNIANTLQVAHNTTNRPASIQAPPKPYVEEVEDEEAPAKASRTPSKASDKARHVANKPPARDVTATDAVEQTETNDSQSPAAPKTDNSNSQTMPTLHDCPEKEPLSRPHEQTRRTLGPMRHANELKTKPKVMGGVLFEDIPEEPVAVPKSSPERSMKYKASRFFKNVLSIPKSPSREPAHDGGEPTSPKLLPQMMSPKSRATKTTQPKPRPNLRERLRSKYSFGNLKGANVRGNAAEQEPPLPALRPAETMNAPTETLTAPGQRGKSSAYYSPVLPMPSSPEVAIDQQPHEPRKLDLLQTFWLKQPKDTKSPAGSPVPPEKLQANASASPDGKDAKESPSIEFKAHHQAKQTEPMPTAPQADTTSMVDNHRVSLKPAVPKSNAQAENIPIVKKSYLRSDATEKAESVHTLGGLSPAAASGDNLATGRRDSFCTAQSDSEELNAADAWELPSTPPPSQSLSHSATLTTPQGIKESDSHASLFSDYTQSTAPTSVSEASSLAKSTSPRQNKNLSEILPPISNSGSLTSSRPLAQVAEVATPLARSDSDMSTNPTTTQRDLVAEQATVYPEKDANLVQLARTQSSDKRLSLGLSKDEWSLDLDFTEPITIPPSAQKDHFKQCSDPVPQTTSLDTFPSPKHPPSKAEVTPSSKAEREASIKRNSLSSLNETQVIQAKKVLPTFHIKTPSESSTKLETPPPVIPDTLHVSPVMLDYL